MGRNNGDFFDGGAAARTDNTGAAEATVHLDGPAALNNNDNSENQFAGHTAGPVAYRGT